MKSIKGRVSAEELVKCMQGKDFVVWPFTGLSSDGYEIFLDYDEIVGQQVDGFDKPIAMVCSRNQNKGISGLSTINMTTGKISGDTQWDT